MENLVQYWAAIIQDLENQIAEMQQMLENARKQKQYAELRSLAFGQSSQVNKLNNPLQDINLLNNPQKQVNRLTPAMEDPGSRPASPQPPSNSNLTIISGAEIVLREAGEPMHATKMVDKMAQKGKIVNVRSLNSTILQDTKNRFKAYGQNVFGLAEWGEDVKPGVLATINGAAPRTGLSIGDALEKAIRDAGQPLKVADIVGAARTMGITASEPSIRSTLASDHRERFIRVTYGVYGLKDMGHKELQNEGQTADLYESLRTNAD